MEDYQTPLDLIYVIKRRGTPDNPYEKITENLTVVNRKVMLNEVPDEFTRVKVYDNEGNYLTESNSGQPNVNQFYVDYRNGFVYFNEADEGKTFIFEYSGTGKIGISYKRIYFENLSEQDTIQTLGDILKEVKKNNEELIGNIDYAGEQGDYAKEQGDYAKIQGDYAKEQGEIAEQKISDVNDKLTEVTQTQEEMDEAIQSANEATSNTQTAIQNANDKASYAQQQGDYAKTQGDYAKEQGDYAKSKGDLANEKASLAQEAADLANAEIDNLSQLKEEVENVTQLANEATTNANNAAQQANSAKDNANTQADYAKEQGDYAKEQAERAELILDDLENIDVGDLTIRVNDIEDRVSANENSINEVQNEIESKADINEVIEKSEKGQPNGVASLDENGKVHSEQLPELTASDVGAETPDGAQAKADQAEANANAYTDQQLATHSAETASKFTNINLNIIDMAVELETLKDATLNGVTANIFVETFTNLNDINLMNGIYDSTNKRLVL